jgi:hypothetical protein
MIGQPVLGHLDQGSRVAFGIDGPPIVMILSDSERRLNVLWDLTRRLGGLSRYWFATLDRLRGGARLGSARGS